MKYEVHTIRAEEYVAPASELIEMTIEGMLCGSNEKLFETGGEW